LGFITAPSEFSHSDQARALTRRASDAPRKSQTQPQDEVNNHQDFGIAPFVVVHPTTGEEAQKGDESSQRTQDDTADNPDACLKAIA
jgi:hypothetical protein